MHDQVSETENIRKNLSIERQIVEGCEMLLDVNQIFVRQGTNVVSIIGYVFTCAGVSVEITFKPFDSQSTENLE